MTAGLLICVAISPCIPCMAQDQPKVIGPWSFEWVASFDESGIAGISQPAAPVDARNPTVGDPGTLGFLMFGNRFRGDGYLVLVQCNRAQEYFTAVDFFDVHYSVDGRTWTTVRDQSAARLMAPASWIRMKSDVEPDVLSPHVLFESTLVVRLERILEYLPADVFHGESSEGVLVKVELVARRPFAPQGESIPILSEPLRIRRIR